jgi:putative ABC transport system permease protein
MTLFKIAFRNILRNFRRSLMTASAIAVGTIALVLFGEYLSFVMVGLETGAVISSGHYTVFKQGYFDFGSGNPAAYSIDNYESDIALIENDPVLKPMLNVVTPSVSLFGIAGNFSIDTSKTFFGYGFVASDREKMRVWDEYQLGYSSRHGGLDLSDSDVTHGVVGVGMARILGICAPLKVADCPPPPRPKEEVVEGAPPPPDVPGLSAGDRAEAVATAADAAPRIDLLGATAGGAPNVVSFYVVKAVPQGIKELDDSYIGMNIKLAQELLYGRGEHKAVSIQIQLNRSEDMQAARARLEELFARHRLDLEIHDFKDMSPQYNQIVSFLSAVFGFISVIIGVIVLFTIVNTMSMSVMERVNEIGTARAMGVRRGGIRLQFLIEGWMLGTIGATLGIVLATLLAFWFNHMGITYTPPGQAAPVPLVLRTHGVGGLLFSVWFILMILATIAAIIPAGRAARMKVVDALRHV